MARTRSGNAGRVVFLPNGQPATATGLQRIGNSARRLFNGSGPNPLNTFMPFPAIPTNPGFKFKQQKRTIPNPQPTLVKRRKLTKRNPSRGIYAGKYRKPKYKSKPKAMDKNGVVDKYENGSIVTSNIRNSVYIGHAVSLERMWRVVLRSILKNCAYKMGVCITDFKTRAAYDLGGASALTGLNYEWRLTLKYRRYKLATTVWDESTFVIPFKIAGNEVVESWDTHVGFWITKLRTDIGDTGFDDLHFGSINMFEYNGVDVSERGRMELENVYLKLGFSSTLTMQNRTNDASGSGNVDSNSVNPLIGKHYAKYKKWCNGFDFAKSNYIIPDPAYLPLFPSNTGVIVTDSQTTENPLLQKVPQGWAISADKTENVILNPGLIKSSKITWSANMKLNTFIGKYHTVVNAGPPNFQKVEIGKADLFGFECLLNDRAETIDIQVSWELNQVYSCSVSAKRPASIPTVIVL